MPTLSVVIAARNEAANIADAVRSAAFADEVLVLDSGSTDATADLARAAGARVLATDWPGYGPQQNRAIDAATGDWIYSLDADERITPALATEIRAAIAAGRFEVFDVPRRSLFVKRFMKHSGWWPDRTRRLFKRGSARFTTHVIHANLATDKPVGHLAAPMTHYSYRDLASVLEKMNRYSSGSAVDLHERGKRGSLGGAIRHGLWAFARTYVFKLGFLDGAEGFMVAVVNAETSYYKHLKLREIQRAGQPLIDEPGP
ncbi:glycosyltransferase family 2 protein [Derxia lacustris]|uniref:glycosyltransferase family 2 protein n=1 Tax=Derxia lacustris TaxID=764842 RepID=UPI000A16CF15|nr:glycosyltransferase family 2 protein [Derxia lacustris]